MHSERPISVLLTAACAALVVGCQGSSNPGESSLALRDLYDSPDGSTALPEGINVPGSEPGGASSTLPGSCAQGMLFGDINGLEATAFVSADVLRQGLGVSLDPSEVFVGNAYIRFAGEIRSGPYSYIFAADIYGASGFGDMVSYADGSSFRIRIDLQPNGFLLATGVFEDDCGGTGCGQYLFTCR